MIKYNNEYEAEIRKIIFENPKNYIRVLKSHGFKGRCPDRTYLVNYIYECTPMLDDQIHTFKTRIYWTLNRLTDFPYCANDKHCMHKMVSTNVKHLESGYPQYCCSKCQHESPKYYAGIRNAIAKKYGVENAFQIDSVKKDLTCRKTEIQAKRDLTRKRHFGDIPGWNLAKSLATRKTRYGSAWNQAAIRESKLKKHGDANYNNSEAAFYTKKENGTLNTSQQEMLVYLAVRSVRRHMVSQYRSDVYPYSCDMYDPDENVYFEYNGSWTHGGHPFGTSAGDAEKLEQWKVKGGKYYKNAIDTWTRRDPEKRRTAVKNGVKLIEFWDYRDVEEYFRLDFKISDLEDMKTAAYKKIVVQQLAEICETAYSEHGKDAFMKFTAYAFPFIRLDDGASSYELKRLELEQTKDQTPSRLIRSFHRSMYMCRQRGKMSPFAYWEFLKRGENFENGRWKKLYFNRFVYSNSKDAAIFRQTGVIRDRTVFEGMQAAGFAKCVSYLKPALAKRLCAKYLDRFNEVFCPFNGFSGIMLGCTVGCGKKFIGRDLNAAEIEESKKLAEYVKNLGYGIDVDIAVADVFENTGKYECMLCCPPYEDIEQWNFDSEGNCIDRNLKCDEWIDVCLERYDCDRYVFIVDEKTTLKYAGHIVEKLENKSHFGKNSECVVVIDRPQK